MTNRTTEEIARGLTEAQRKELHHITTTGYPCCPVHQNPRSPQVAAALARLGLLDWYWQDERPIHEPLRRWKVYRLTPLGLAVRSHLEGQKP